MTRNEQVTLSELMKDQVEPGMIVDLLQDVDSSLSDVLSLYVGTPPTWLNGIGKTAFDLWLHRNDRADRANAVGRLEDLHPREFFFSVEDGIALRRKDLSPLYQYRKSFACGWIYPIESTSFDGVTVYCPECKVNVESGVSMSWPRRWNVYLGLTPTTGTRISAVEFTCEKCDSLLSLFDPVEWLHVRRLKNAILSHFPDVQVKELKTCAFMRIGRHDESALRGKCKYCNGNGYYWTGGTISAAELIEL